VQGVIAYLKGRGFKPEKIGLFGHSRGAAIGLMAMGRNQDLKAMVADSAYANLEQELEYAFSANTGGILPSFCLPGMLVAASLLQGINVNQVRPEEAVKGLKGQPLLLIQGDKDTLVAPDNIYRLKAAAGDAAEMWVIKGAAHTNGPELEPQAYFSRILAFFEREL